MKFRSLVIGALFFGSIAAIGATALMVNGQFMNVEASGNTLVAAKAFKPMAPVPLLGPNQAVGDFTSWADGYPDGAAFCELARKEGSFSDPEERLFAANDGWVFRKDELGWPSSAVDTEVYRSLGDLGQALAGNGTRLIVLISPPRVVTGAAHLSGISLRHTDPSAALQAYRAILDSLRREGVFAPDLLDEADFNKVPWDRLADTASSNWTALGAKMAAYATARIIQADERWRSVRRMNAAFDRSGPSANASGYLDQLARICGRTENMRRVPTFQNSGGISAQSPEGAALVPAEVVLAGGSMSAREDLYNFKGFLSEAIGSPVHNLSLNGASPTQVLGRYLGSGSAGIARPKFIVLEFSPLSIPISTDMAQISTISDKNCTNMVEKIVDFDWNNTKIFNEQDLAGRKGERARLSLASQGNFLQDSKITVENFDGKMEQIEIMTEDNKPSGKELFLNINNIDQIRSIYFLPTDIKTGKIKARLCSVSA